MENLIKRIQEQDIQLLNEKELDYAMALQGFTLDQEENKEETAAFQEIVKTRNAGTTYQVDDSEELLKQSIYKLDPDLFFI